MDAAGVFIDPDRCTGCGLCILTCGRKLIAMDHDVAVVGDPFRCSRCGHCKSVCVADAPRLTGFDSADFIGAPTRNELPSPHQALMFMRFRRSTRNFTGQPVSRETVFSIIDAGRYAPTAQNRQALHFVAVIQPENVDILRSFTIDELVRQADRLEKATKIGNILTAGRCPFPGLPGGLALYGGTWKERHRPAVS